MYCNLFQQKEQLLGLLVRELLELVEVRSRVLKALRHCHVLRQSAVRPAPCLLLLLLLNVLLSMCRLHWKLERVWSVLPVIGHRQSSCSASAARCLLCLVIS